MTDKFTKAAVGEAVLVISEAVYKVETAVTKGQVVAVQTHVDDGLPTIQPATDGSLVVVGVAQKDGAVGESIPVLKIGIIKCAGGDSGCTLGKHIMAAASTATAPTLAANGNVEDADAYNKVIGRALQTIASGDTGLVFISI